MEKLPVIILDTDIGPDCDDVGALVMLLNLEKEGLCRLAAVTHCTSNPFGAPCVDAVCRFYGRSDMAIGTLKKGGILDGAECRRYNEAVARVFPNRFQNGEEAEDAQAVLRRVVEAEDEVTIAAIGPLSNLGPFARDNGALLKRKNTKLVSMGGGQGGPEFNFFVDVEATAQVLEFWPGEAEFSIFETGVDVITGKNLQSRRENTPLKLAYGLYSPSGRSSWDQTTAYCAVFEGTPLFKKSGPGKMSVDKTGKSAFEPGEGGRHKILEKAAPAAEIAAVIDGLMEKGHA